MSITDDKIQERIDQFMDVCEKAGVRITHQRIEIFREMAMREDHPDADAIYQCVRQRVHGVSLDTVYRTLWLFSDLGIAHPMGMSRERIRFDANLKLHHHYTCIRCGMIRDIESPEYDALGVPESAREMGSIVSTKVEVQGVCSRCASTRKSKPDRKGALPPGAKRKENDHVRRNPQTDHKRRSAGS